MSARVAGLLLAAGAGSRMGRPKALVDDWLPRGVAALRGGGCDPVAVVLGARAEEARPLVPAGAEVVVAERWADGLAASLRAGLGALPDLAPHVDAVLVTLVDLPDVGAPVVARLLERTAGPSSLARAVFDGRPGHPVLLGRDHWVPLAREADGDRGAGPYLRAHGADAVECGDLATGDDVDHR